MDELLFKLERSGLGFKLYNVYCGILMYADDILLLCSSITKLQLIVDICVSFPSQHVQLGYRWGPDGLSLGPQVGSPLGAQLTLATVFKWVLSGLPIWASPSGAQLGPTEMFILACI